MNHNWKEVTRRVRDMHQALGVSCITLEGVNALSLTPCIVAAPTHPRLTLPTGRGDALSLASIRSFLWEHRRNPVLREDDPVVWSVYDPEASHTTVGLGHLIPSDKVEWAKSVGFEVLTLEESDAPPSKLN